MYFEKIHIEAFGQFFDRSLEFTPGLNVVFGPNESGKSTWHAALVASLAGRRRARGRKRSEDLALERYLPWNGESWCIRAIVVRSDGRRLEIRQDLHKAEESTVWDLDRSRTFEPPEDWRLDKALDASRLLGLDRTTLARTICIRQGELLRHDLNDREQRGMQGLIEKAAQDLEGDETVEGALDVLVRFREERIGTDAHHSKKPLKRAKDWVEQAADKLRRARERRREYEEVLRSLDRATFFLGESRRGHLEREIERLEDLEGEFPGGRASLGERRRHREEILSEVRRCEERQELDLGADDGTSLADLEAELAKLEALPPDGDLQPAAELLRRVREVQDGRARLAVVRAQLAEMPAPDVDEGIDVELLRRRLAVLEREVPEGDPQAEEELERSRLARFARLRRCWLGVAAGIVLVALGGLLLSIPSATLPGGTALVVGMGIIGWGAWVGRTRRGMLSHLSELEQRISYARRVHCGHVEDLFETRAELERSGFAVDPDGLRETIESLTRARGTRELRNQVEAQERVLAGSLAAIEELLTRALEGRLVHEPGSDDPVLRFERYETECAVRRQRQELQRSLAALRPLQERRHKALAADARFVARAAQLGGEVQSVPEALEFLRQWERDEDVALREREARWEALEQLQERRPGIEAELEKCRAARGALLQRLGDEVLSEETDGADEEALRHEVERWRGRAEQIVLELPDLAEAEEDLERARTEYERLAALDRTIRITEEFLGRARDSVQGTIAPKIRVALERDLPRVTSNRYGEVSANLDVLDVNVRAQGVWRSARELSYGTAEQIHLLLRLALVDALSHPEEAAPLLMDEVTVHSDAERKRAFLELLLEKGQERQIVFFTQEDVVLGWARDRGPAVHVIELEGP